MKSVPKWQQGFRPLSHGDVWDAMSPGERRSAFVSDVLVAFAGAGLIWLLASLLAS